MCGYFMQDNVMFYTEKFSVTPYKSYAMNGW